MSLNSINISYIFKGLGIFAFVFSYSGNVAAKDRTIGVRIAMLTEATTAYTVPINGKKMARRHMLQGKLHYHAGNYTSAIDQYSLAIEHQPGFYQSYILRGDAYFKSKQYLPAIGDYSAAINFQPNNVRGYIKRGSVYAFSGDDRSALKDYTDAIRMDPDHGVTYKQRAYIHLRRRHFAKAEADMRSALKYLPGDPEIRHSLGDVFYYSGRVDEAKRHWHETCVEAGTRIRRSWQKRLSAVGRYTGPINGKCSSDLVNSFATCAKDKCQF